MPTKFIASALILAGIHGLATLPLRRKYNAVAHLLLETHDTNVIQQQQIGYLVDLILEHEIELSEFDVIMLTSLKS